MTRPNIDLRERLAPGIHDQGPRPTCVPFAVSLAHESNRYQARDPAAALAPEAIWEHAWNRGLAGHNGMDLAHANDALRERGQPEDQNWPYDATLGSDTEPPPLSAGVPPWHVAELSTIPLALDGVEDAVEDSIAAGRVVVLVLGVTAAFDYPDADGLILPSPGPGHRGLHAVAAVGAAEVAGSGRCLLIQNSWGEGWGLGGYGWLHPSYIQGLGISAHEVLRLPMRTPVRTDVTTVTRAR
ncbi:C1 family peptidase [Agromyces mariniharenae]